MGLTINCKTLFDITRTNISNRRPPLDMGSDTQAWQEKRNTQTNLDTLIQIISLRAQPERISDPVKKPMTPEDLENFGFLFENEENLHYWSFNFFVNHDGVFYNGIDELGSLYSDCDTVPMIKTKTVEKVEGFLDASPELKNIHFEVVGRE